MAGIPLHESAPGICDAWPSCRASARDQWGWTARPWATLGIGAFVLLAVVVLGTDCSNAAWICFGGPEDALALGSPALPAGAATALVVAGLNRGVGSGVTRSAGPRKPRRRRRDLDGLRRRRLQAGGGGGI